MVYCSYNCNRVGKLNWERPIRKCRKSFKSLCSGSWFATGVAKMWGQCCSDQMTIATWLCQADFGFGCWSTDWFAVWSTKYYSSAIGLTYIFIYKNTMFESPVSSGQNWVAPLASSLGFMDLDPFPVSLRSIHGNLLVLVLASKRELINLLIR